MNSCAREQFDTLKDRVRFLSRRFAGSVVLASQIDDLQARLLSPSPETMAQVTSRLRELSEIAPRVKAAMEEYDAKASVDRAEGFLADLAEDRSSAPPEIIPLVEDYISRLREVIAQAWNRRITRRELDAHVMQVRLSYSQDLDRILQGLLPHAAE